MTESAPDQFLTVGHSMHPLESFVQMLRSVQVELVVDVRRLPGSNRCPQFNQDALEQSLPQHGISYRRAEALGGRRSRDRSVPDEVNGFWENRSFHHYADYALSTPFAGGLKELIGWGARTRLAVMCSEAVWWRCHRRIIADHLLARGHPVLHLMGVDRAMPAELTPGAVVDPDDGQVTYPAQ
ncbi:DUF488 family protein [Micrococcus terreus]|uniref:DUF488 domain-containing protein n=1 Tax=Micrococcus terreus TaxID=574650 RepID=UPI003D721E64